MIIDTEKIPHASYFSSGKGHVEMELEETFPDMRDKKGQYVIFAVMFCYNLVIVYGTVKKYEELERNPDLPEQDVWAKLSINGQSVTISF